MLNKRHIATSHLGKLYHKNINFLWEYDTKKKLYCLLVERMSHANILIMKHQLVGHCYLKNTTNWHLFRYNRLQNGHKILSSAYHKGQRHDFWSYFESSYWRNALRRLTGGCDQLIPDIGSPLSNIDKRWCHESERSPPWHVSRLTCAAAPSARSSFKDKVKWVCCAMYL